MRIVREVGRELALAVGVVTVATAGGCSTMSNTEKGVGLGAATGAGVGTVVGALTHHPGLGAVAGGLVGAGVGGAVGNNIDRKEEQRKDIQMASAVANAQTVQNAQRMGLIDVVQMAKGGHDPQVIINQIRNTNSTFQLSHSDLDFLKANDVPPAVILEMQNAHPQPVVMRPARPVVVQQSPEIIYAAPPPPPVVVVGPRPYYGGGFYYRRW